MHLVTNSPNKKSRRRSACGFQGQTPASNLHQPLGRAVVVILNPVFVANHLTV